MNRQRRKTIKDIIGQLQICLDALYDLNAEEEESRSNTPENLQGGDKYSLSEDSSSKIEDAMADIEEAISYLEEI